jgi:hypothetical protein
MSNEQLLAMAVMSGSGWNAGKIGAVGGPENRAIDSRRAAL